MPRAGGVTRVEDMAEATTALGAAVAAITDCGQRPPLNWRDSAAEPPVRLARAPRRYAANPPAKLLGISD